MARTNRHIACLDLTRESRFGSRLALGTKTPTFRFYGRAKAANGNACADSGAKYNGFMRTGFARLLRKGRSGFASGPPGKFLADNRDTQAQMRSSK